MPAPNAPSAVPSGSSQPIQNARLFQELTERQEMPQPATVFPGFGKKQRIEVEKIGVLARARLIVNLKFETPTKGEATLLPGWPYSFIKEIALQTNGVTGILDARATTYEQRRRRVYRNPVKKTDEYPAVGKLKEEKKAYSTRFLLEIPVAHDMLSLLGCLLAQNEQTQLSFNIQWANESEVVKMTEGALEKVEGSLEWSTTVFSIGETTEGNKSVTVLPDLSAFHGLLDETVPILGAGEKKAPLIRTAGQLLAYTMTIMSAGGVSCILPSSWEQYVLEYGGNKKPLIWQPPYNLLEENEDDYNGPLTVGEMNYLVVDNEKDNPTRDLWIPEALVELRSSTTISKGVEVAAGSYQLYSQETLYPAS